MDSLIHISKNCPHPHPGDLLREGGVLESLNMFKVCRNSPVL